MGDRRTEPDSPNPEQGDDPVTGRKDDDLSIPASEQDQVEGTRREERRPPTLPWAPD